MSQELSKSQQALVDKARGNVEAAKQAAGPYWDQLAEQDAKGGTTIIGGTTSTERRETIERIEAAQEKEGGKCFLEALLGGVLILLAFGVVGANLRQWMRKGGKTP